MGCCDSSTASDSDTQRKVLSVNERYSPKQITTMICRNLIRELFGVKMMDLSGYFIDNQMSTIIYRYSMIPYPKKNQSAYVFAYYNRTQVKVNCMVLTNDGLQLYVGTDIHLALWDLINFRRVLSRKEKPMSLDYHASGKLAIGLNSQVMVLDIHKDYRLIRQFCMVRGDVQNTKFTLKGNAVLYSGFENTLHLSCLITGDTLRYFDHWNVVRKTLWIDEYHFVSGSDDECLRLWHFKKNEFICKYPNMYPKSLNDFTLNPPRNKIAYCTKSMTMIYDWMGGDVSSSLEDEMTMENKIRIEHGGRCLCFHPFYHYILAVASIQVLESNDTIIQIFDVRNGEQIQSVFVDDYKEINDLKFTPDGSRIVTICNQGKIGLWNVSHIDFESSY